MAQTFQEWVSKNRKEGFTADEIKAGFFERYGVKLEDQDPDADYDAFKVQKQVQGVLPFVSQEALQAPQTPTPTPTPVQPVSKPTTPAPAPAAAPYTGPSLSQGQPIESEGFIKSAARAVIPDVFGIEEAVLGPKPVVYDKAKTEAEIAKFQTIKPDEYELSTKQLVRPVGFAAGVAAEVPKLATEIGVQTAAAVQRRDPKEIRSRLGRAVADLSPAESQEAFEPKASKEVVRQFAPSFAETKPELEAAEQQLRSEMSKDVYSLMQEDAAEVLTGLGVGLFTDIIPILPEQDPTKTTTQVFKEAYERGTQLPAALAAFGPIGYEAASRFAKGDTSGAIRYLSSKPATLAITLAPFAAKYPRVGNFVKKYATYLPKKTLEGAGYVAERVAPETTVGFKQKFVDPLTQTSPQATAVAERIYEESRATRAKTERATEQLAEEARRPEADVKTSPAFLTPEGAVEIKRAQPDFEQRVKSVDQYHKQRDAEILSKRQQREAQTGRKVNLEKEPPQRLTRAELEQRQDFTEPGTERQVQLAEQKLAKEFGENHKTIANEREAYIAEGEELIKKVEQGGETLQETLDYEKYIREREQLLRDQELYNQAKEKALQEVNQEVVQLSQPAGDFLVDLEKQFNQRFLNESKSKGAQLSPEELKARTQQRLIERRKGTPAVLTEGAKELSFQERSGRLVDAEGKAIFEEPGDFDRQLKAQLEDVSARADQLVKEGVTDYQNVSDLLSQEDSLVGQTWREIQATEPKIFDLVKKEYWDKGESLGEATPVPQTTTLQLPEPLRQDIIQSFEPSYPQGASIRYREQLSPGIRKIIAQGAADIAQGNELVLLGDPSTRTRFLKKLIREANPGARSVRRQYLSALDAQLQDAFKRGQTGTTQIKIGDVLIDNQTLRSKLLEFLNIEDVKNPTAGKTELFREVRDLTQFRVRNAAFKQSLADNIRHETAGYDLRGNPLTTNVETARSILDYYSEQNTLPPSVYVSPGLEFLDVVSLVEQQNPLLGQTLRKYVPPSTTLERVVGRNTYVAKSFNSSFTNILEGMNAIESIDAGWFNYFTKQMKIAYTSRNLSSARNNLKSNVLLYTLFYGLGAGVEALTGIPKAAYRAVLSDVAGKEFNPSKPFLRENLAAYERYASNQPLPNERVFFRALRESGFDSNRISNEVSLLNKESPLSSLIEKGGAEVGGIVEKGANKVAKGIKKLNSSQDTLYSFGDEYFKFLSAYNEYALAKTGLDAMIPIEVADKRAIPLTYKASPRDITTIRVGEATYVDLVKVGDRYHTVNKNSQVSRQPLSEQQLTRYLAKASARLANEKFVDYERVPGYVNFLRSGSSGGIVSLFTTWSYKMMDLPWKRGIAGHFLSGESVISKSGSPAVAEAISQIKVNRGAARVAAMALAKTTIDEEMDGDVKRMMMFNKNAMPMVDVKLSQIDPWAFVWKDESATNFFGPTDQSFRAFIGGGLWAYEAFMQSSDNVAGDLSVYTLQDGETPPDDDPARREWRKIFLRWKAGQLISAKESLQLAGVGGNPIYEIVDLGFRADQDASIKLTSVIAAIGKNMMLGGTGRALSAHLYRLAVTHEDVLKSPSLADKTILADEYKKSLQSAFRSSQREGIDNQQKYLTFARAGVDMVLGTAYRMSYANKIINKKDYGGIARWADDFGKKLEKDLLREHKQRLQAMAATGDSPELEEEAKRYAAMLEAVKTQVAGFKLRIFDAVERTGYYQRVEE